MRKLNNIEVLSTTGGTSVLDSSPEDLAKWVGAGLGFTIGWREGMDLWSWTPVSGAPDVGSYAAGVVGAVAGAAVGGWVGNFTATQVVPRLS